MRMCGYARIAGGLLLSLLVATASSPPACASDHSDAPTGPAGARLDANISDLHAFVVGSNLVLALSTNTAIPLTATGYLFPTDVTFEFNIDVDSAVSPADPYGDGGTVLYPDRISEDITFRVRFRADGSVKLQRIVRGKAQDDPQVVNFFAGLRDDPFIRAPRAGRNVGSIVIEVPLGSVLSSQSTLLLWATAKVEEFEGPHQEIVGRSLRSMFPEQNSLNRLHPKHHLRIAGLRPDVMIFDTSAPATFPNGRALTDDVIDLACTLSMECRVFNSAGEGPTGPTANDVPFLSTFPYLAPPHPAP